MLELNTNRSKTRAALVIVALGVLLALGCSKSSSTSGGSDTATPGDTTGDTTTNPGVKNCTSNDDCPGQVCLLDPPNGLSPLCVDSCQASTSCPDPNYVCDTSDGVCKPKFGSKPAGSGCGSNSECSLGLSCVNKLCTKSCSSNTDCPEPTECRAVKPGDTAKICQNKSYCSSCSTDADCGSGNKCHKDKNNAGFCSYSCTDSGKSCPGGHECKNFSDGGKSVWYCYPLDGACKGDGTVCATCGSDSDCASGHFCYSDPATTEKYCTRYCEKVEDCGSPSVEVECVQPEGASKMQCRPKPTSNVQGAMGTCFAGKTKLCGYCEDDSWCNSEIALNGKTYKATCFVALTGDSGKKEDGSNICTIDCSNDPTICPSGFNCVTNAQMYDPREPDKFKACRPASPTSDPSALACNSGFLCADKTCTGPLLTGECELGQCVQCPDPVSCK
ncbi:MAG: hypothetical protein KC609_13795 [Myxococcales bacterium]|nr:hypothetical protein [Myxococcales bacterium]